MSTATTGPAPAPGDYELTTVADDEVVLHRRGGEGVEPEVVSLRGLLPDQEVDVHGVRVRTLPRPPGELLCRVATVNDVHFGEESCGALADLGDLPSALAGDGADLAAAAETAAALEATLAQLGPTPVLRSPPGATPYPVMMSTAAAREIAAIDPAAVVVKGDLTARGRLEEYRAFLDCYETAFGERLVHVRGNHDAMSGERYADAPLQVVRLPGATLVVLDTVVEGSDSGKIDGEQLDALDEIARTADGPVLVFGHHHPWNPGSAVRHAGYFGINPDDSERLVEVVRRRPAVIGYFAGHTHRNRVRRFAATGSVPYVEVASVKDYPGSWAEYRVYEGGILQVHRRVSSPEALAWSEAARQLYWGYYPSYALGTLEDRCLLVPRRSGA